MSQANIEIKEEYIEGDLLIFGELCFRVFRENG